MLCSAVPIFLGGMVWMGDHPLTCVTNKIFVILP